MKILVAYDGSEYADNAIEDLPRAGLPRDAEASIVYVQERWLPPPAMYEIVEQAVFSPPKTAAGPALAREVAAVESVEDDILLLEKGRRQLVAHFPDWTIETHFLKGSPSTLIRQTAEKWNADLVVVGSKGAGDNRLFALGSVSQKLANEAACSVRIVRGNAPTTSAPGKILLALDGSDASRQVVEEVARRKWPAGTEIRLLTATDKPLAKNGDLSDKTGGPGLWINLFISHATEILRAAGLNVSEMIVQGNPKSIIVAVADEWGADCIFIGASAKSGLIGDLLLGSVSTAVVSRANCTVEVVRKIG